MLLRWRKQEALKNVREPSEVATWKTDKEMGE
jgi:hypothetical protein